MKTEVIQLRNFPDPTAPLRHARDVLNSGGLVAFPTETVYGLAACADNPQALQRLAELKQRPPDKPFTLHIGQMSALDRYVPTLSPRNRKLLRKAWPGPLTVVFALDQLPQAPDPHGQSPEFTPALYHNNTIGIRLPDHPIAQKLLSSLDAPVVAPSANLASAPPPVDADDVLAQLDGHIELILDSGPTRYRKASTVIKLNADDMEILREGVLDGRFLERLRTVVVLLVCTGNTCRSAMAAGFCRHELAKKLSCPVDQIARNGYKVVSAGIMALSGAPATPEAQQACRESQVDISDHRAQLLGTDIVNEADYIFAMASSHYQTVVTMAPDAAERTWLLAGDRSIEDPIGMPLEVYRGCAELIRRHLAEQLAQHGLI